MPKINKYHPLNYLMQSWWESLKKWFSRTSKPLLFLVWAPLILLLIFSVNFYLTVYPAPGNFPVESVVIISEGSTLSEVAEHLEEKDVISSAFWLEHLVRIFGNETQVLAGKYLFEERKSLFDIAQAISTGGFEPELVKITIPEGATTSDIGLICNNHLKGFNRKKFLSIAMKKEGFLFPDTYYFPPEVDEKTMVDTMRNNFFGQIGSIEKMIEKNNHSLREIIIMASLLEKEAHKYENKRMIAGILWKRLEIGMPLQVDAVFTYINGKSTFDLTLRDLRMKSPYNTYRYEGLPAGPIANPGLESIKAAASPAESNYLYYLSDMRNQMHYSETFEEHKRKKRRYLN